MTGRDVVPAEPVYDAELVNDTTLAKVSAFTNWRVRSRRVPEVFRSRQAAKDAAAWLARLPFRLLGAVGRGLVVGLRAWRRWVRVVDHREAAEQAEKLA